MKKYILPVAFLTLLSVQSAFGQSIYDDAKILSLDESNGTARFKALGGVNTSLGGDISSISGNPAGLGFFGQSDASISFNMLNNNNKTSFYGQNQNKNFAKFGVDNAGVVLAFPTAYNQDVGWQNFNIGLSVNRQNNYNDKVVYSGINSENTLVQSLTDAMFGSPSFTNDFRRSYLVEAFGDNPKEYFPIALEGDPKGQQVDILSGGYKYLSNFSVGANYSHNFYIGAGVGLLSYKNSYSRDVYERGWTKTAEEISPDNPNSLFLKPGSVQNSYTDINYALTDRYSSESTGYGANFNIGMILKPSWDWNFGLTFTSPTWTTIKFDDYLDTQAEYYQDDKSTNQIRPKYISEVGGESRDYSIISPWKTAIGLTKFFGRGLISADLEFVGYDNVKYVNEAYNANAADELAINRDLKNSFKSNFNFRAGAEYVFTDRFTGRAGFNYLGSPYENTSKGSYIGSLGLGYIFPNAMYIDLTAMKYESSTYYDVTYNLDDIWKSPAPEAEIKNSRTNVVMTLGVKF